MSELTADDIELTIDEEFAKLVPRHTENESEELRKSVEIEGKFHYPILFWRNNGDNLVVDGRHRFELWCSLPEGTPVPPPELKEVFYPDRESVRKVILRDRLARSSLDTKSRKLLIGRLYNEEKSDSSENLKIGKNTSVSSMRQSGASVETAQQETTAAEAVAQETGTPARTVQRYGAIAESLDIIGSVNGKAKADIESGVLKVKDRDVIAIGKLDTKAQIGKALTNLRKGEDWTTGLGVPNPKKSRKPRKPNPKSSLKELASSVGAVSRALVKAGKEHGEGPQYKAIFDALTGIKKSIAEWK